MSWHWVKVAVKEKLVTGNGAQPASMLFGGVSSDGSQARDRPASPNTAPSGNQKMMGKVAVITKPIHGHGAEPAEMNLH